jgi:hypothetical protein
MTNQDLFKEAIADAKAIRETALANAKVALEEALAPRLQSMLAAKLQEMEGEDLEEAKDKDDEKMEEGFYPSETSDKVQDRYRATGAALEEGDDELEEDFDLSEILAELEEAKKEEEKEKMEEAKEEEEEGEEEESESTESETVADLSVEELKMIIKDIISSEMEDGGIEDMGSGEMEAGDEMSVDVSDEGEEMEEDLDLEELLAELDALGEDYSEETEYEEGGMYEAKKKMKKAKEEDDKMKKELDEAIATIHTLRSELNEVNLLNAKLLYVNKIFKAKNLTESQKLKVIAQFDKAATIKEAKMIYETMDVAIVKSAKSSIKESMGFASKAAGVAKKPIVEVDETMSRWQMLAGIKKH